MDHAQDRGVITTVAAPIGTVAILVRMPVAMVVSSMRVPMVAWLFLDILEPEFGDCASHDASDLSNATKDVA